MLAEIYQVYSQVQHSTVCSELAIITIRVLPAPILILALEADDRKSYFLRR